MNQTADIAYGRDAIISRKELKPYVKRTNWHGMVWLGAHLALLAATGALVVAALGTWWIVPATLLHGGVMAFLFAPVHECSHRTPFRALWLNETVYWGLCLIYLVPPTFFRYSHAAHHTYTQIRGKDPDMVMPERSTVWDYIVYVSGVPFWARNLSWYVEHALGDVNPAQKYFLPVDEIPKVVREARIILAVYAGIAALAVATGSWAPLTLWIIPRLVGEPVMRWIRIAEHAECAEGGDLTVNTRTTKAMTWMRLLFWNMPYHAEHHLCPMVPFHALPELSTKVGDKLHCKGEGYVEVHADVLTKLARHEGVTWAEPERAPGA
ncbi:MAG: fatty acid desaturase [Methyloligellaceae bacterium]